MAIATARMRCVKKSGKSGRKFVWSRTWPDLQKAARLQTCRRQILIHPYIQARCGRMTVLFVQVSIGNRKK